MGFIKLFTDLFEKYGGWFLTFLSSVMCILGASVIYLDALIRVFNRRSTFDIKTNQNFLICGFSISAGSLIFTSLYKLLPKSLEYFRKVEQTNFFRPDSEVLIYYFGGIVVCFIISEVIHKFTSESIVHCNHTGEHDDDLESGQHFHSHAHSESLSDSLSDESTNNKHAHSNSYSNSHSNSHSHSHSNSHSRNQSSDSSDSKNLDRSQLKVDSLHLEPVETSPLLGVTEAPEVQKKKSILAFLGKLNPQNECVGIDDVDCIGTTCVSDDITKHVSYDLQHIDFYRDHKPMSAIVAYTTQETPPVVVARAENSKIDSNPGNFVLTNEPDLHLHSTHKDDHHHKINTPISKLLSIGLQTCMALTLHKFPEGFITYATSKVDPNLGISIFLSLAIHNIIEGFSMTLPLYLAFNSRWKALGIASILGGLSQPIGALLGYFLLRDKSVHQDESSHIFGILVAITSGFLTVISLQLFASAINFGGTQNQVIIWCLLGILTILFSTALTAY